MTSVSHQAKLREGAQAWNAWRAAHPDAIPDLAGVALSLSERQLGPFHGGPVDLSRAMLQGTDLSNSLLTGADFSRAVLSGVSFVSARLNGARFAGANLNGATLDDADLEGADLTGALLSGAVLKGARNLSQAQIETAHGDDSTILPDHLSIPAHWRAVESPHAADAHPAEPRDEDLYGLLGVPRDASDNDIRDAYYVFAKANHPDRLSGGEDEAFKRITRAARILRDPKKRKLYDRGDIDASGIITASGKNRIRRLDAYRTFALCFLAATGTALGAAYLMTRPAGIGEPAAFASQDRQEAAPPAAAAQGADPQPPASPEPPQPQTAIVEPPAPEPAEPQKAEIAAQSAPAGPGNVTGSLNAHGPIGAREASETPEPDARAASIDEDSPFTLGRTMEEDVPLPGHDRASLALETTPPLPQSRGTPFTPEGSSEADAGQASARADETVSAKRRAFPSASLDEWPRKCDLTRACASDEAWCDC